MAGNRGTEWREDGNMFHAFVDFSAVISEVSLLTWGEVRLGFGSFCMMPCFFVFGHLALGWMSVAQTVMDGSSGSFPLVILYASVCPFLPFFFFFSFHSHPPCFSSFHFPSMLSVCVFLINTSLCLPAGVSDRHSWTESCCSFRPYLLFFHPSVPPSVAGLCPF